MHSSHWVKLGLSPTSQLSVKVALEIQESLAVANKYSIVLSTGVTHSMHYFVKIGVSFKE